MTRLLVCAITSALLFANPSLAQKATFQKEEPGIKVPAGWKKFEIKNRFSVYYPPSIFTPKEMANGVTLETPFYIEDGSSTFHFEISFEIVTGDLYDRIKTEMPACFERSFPEGAKGTFKTSSEGGCLERVPGGFTHKRIGGAVSGPTLSIENMFLTLLDETLVVKLQAFNPMDGLRYRAIPFESQELIIKKVMQTFSYRITEAFWSGWRK